MDDVRAMPRVRDRVPVGRAVRAADGGHSAFPRRRREAHTSVAAARHRRRSATIACCSPERARWPLRSGCTWCPRGATRSAGGSRCGRRRCGATGHRRVALHRLRHGRVARDSARGRAAGAERRGRGRRRFPGRAATAAVRSTSTPGSPTTPAASPVGSCRRCPVRRRSSSTRLAAVPRSRTTATSSAPTRPRAFSARVHDIHEWLAPRTRLASRRRHVQRRGLRCRIRATSVTCNAPTSQSARCWLRTSSSSSSTTRGCAAEREARTRRCTPRRRARSGQRKLESIARCGGPTVVVSANPGCALHLAAAGLRGPSPDGDRRPVPREWSPRWPVSSTRSRPARGDRRGARRPRDRAAARVDRRGATERPVDERRLTHARRSVEKAIAILREPTTSTSRRLTTRG